MSKTAELKSLEFPFAAELITDRRGQIARIVLNLRDYRAPIEAVEDAGLYGAMKRAAKDKPISREAALALLDAK